MERNFFGFDPGFAMFDITPVENLFIQEYMPRANGDFVKVYLYGLMQCYHPVESMSLHVVGRELGLDDQSVENAMKYWERMGLVRRVSDNPPSYVYLSLKQMAHVPQEDDGVYVYADFNKSLQNLFSPERMLHPAEYSMVYDWIENRGISEEAVLMLVAGYIQKSGGKKKFSFKTLDKIAAQWAAAGVRTLQDAEDYTRQESDHADALRQVYRRLGKRHAISEVDDALFVKWQREWGFDLPTILAACEETSKGSPTMGYVDGVLRRMHEQGLQSAEDLKKDAQEDERVKVLLEQLGLRGTSPTQDSRALLEGFHKAGFTDEIIQMAAIRVARRGNKLDSLKKTLDIWAENNLFTKEQVEKYLSEVDARRAQKGNAGAKVPRLDPRIVPEQYGNPTTYTDEELQNLITEI